MISIFQQDLERLIKDLQRVRDFKNDGLTETAIKELKPLRDTIADMLTKLGE